MAFFLGKGQTPLNQNPYSQTNPQGDTGTLSNQGAPDATMTTTGGDEESIAQCKTVCDDRRDRDRAAGVPRHRYLAAWRRCNAMCEKTGKPTPDSTNPGGPDVPQPTPEEGGGCEGGYKIDKTFVGGKGAGAEIWQDPRGIIPAKYTRSADWEGHWVYDPGTGRFYRLEALYKHYESGAPFPKGRRRVCKKDYTRKGNWCCPNATDADSESDVVPVGEFKWPAEMYSLYSQLMNRGGEFMNRTPGFTPGYLQTTFGRNFEDLRRAGDVAREEVMGGLQREGLAGTGAAQDVAMDMAWGTERGIGNLIRDLFLLNEDQKRKDILDFTSAGRDILGSGMGFIGMEEDINARRRGEEAANLAMFLQYLTSLMNAWR